ncbi:MAG: dipeptide epimerase [Flavobacteriaceae bacterium]|nr:MAG: dipeptide epimerase [Flavobacteriaceae bacterium]
MITLDYFHQKLYFHQPFKLSGNQRNFTDSVIVKLQNQNLEGYGEACLPPYLVETKESVEAFLKKVDPLKLNLFHLEETMDYLDSLSGGNCAVKAALDMAMHDLLGKIESTPVCRYYDSEFPTNIQTVFTIGLSSEEEMLEKLETAKDFKTIKLKLGSEKDLQIVEFFLSQTKQSFCVDVNQGWKSQEEALEKSLWMQEKGALFIEQPMPKTRIKENKIIRDNLQIPLLADESFQTLADLDSISENFSGINIKLSKCGGIFRAAKIIEQARKKNLKIMLGCMSESSCAIAAGAHLASRADFVDLDSPMLIKNDPFDGILYKNGNLSLISKKGLGIKRRENEDY